MSQIKQKFLLTKESGVLNENQLNMLIQAIHGLKDNKYLIEVSRYYKKHSDKQRGFYFGNFLQAQIDCFKEFWGETYTKEQIHDFNKINFWGTEKMLDSGEIIKMPGTSSDKSTIEYEEVLEKIREWHRITFEFELPYPQQQAEIF